MSEDRKKKADTIIDMYTNREYRQTDIAKELGMSVNDVGKVTRAYGYAHGKKMQGDNPNNLNQNQLIPAIIDYDKMKFLDKYNF